MNGIQPLLLIGLAGALGAMLRFVMTQGVMRVLGLAATRLGILVTRVVY